MRLSSSVVARVLILSSELLLATCRLYPPPIVPIAILVQSPEQFRDHYISIEGRSAGGVVRPACESHGEPQPPGNFVLQPMITDSRVVDPRQDITFLYKPTLEEDYGLDYQKRARLAVGGWWRYYDGPNYCGGEHVQRWYLEADEVRFLDPVPQRPTDLPNPFARPTATPSLPESTTVPTS